MPLPSSDTLTTLRTASPSREKYDEIELDSSSRAAAPSTSSQGRGPADTLPADLSEKGHDVPPSPRNIDLEASEPEPAPMITDKGGGDINAPDGGYGWVIVGCMIASNAATWGINTTFGVYTSFLIENDYFAGGSALNYAWVGGLSVAVCLLCGPLANYISRRFGFKVCYALGMLGTVLGQCMAGICTTYGTFLVCQGVVFGIGLGLTMIPVMPLLAHWFHRRLALAQGLAASGSGLGGLVWCNTTPLLIDRYSLKWALIVNGCCSAVLLLPGLVLLKGRHKAVGARQAPLELKWLWHGGFMWIWLWGAFCIMAYFIALYSLASFATHALHLTQAKGAALQSILSAGQAIGRPIWGYSLDTGGRINLTVVCYLICGLSTLAIWLPARSFGVLVFFAIVQGMTGGTIWSVAAPVTARVVGVQDLASALSIFWLSLVVPALAGQPIAIALLNYSTNSLGREGASAYFISIGFCGGLSVCCACLLYGSKVWLQGDWKVFKKT
ncbi:hypothetical protein IAT38_002702 [Cryptococcus sp. DSM 104549]